MIYTNSITNAIYTILSSDAVLVSSSIPIDLYGEYPDAKMAQPSPVISIVPGELGIDVELAPATIGGQNPWMASMSIPLVISAVDRNKQRGMQKLDELELYTLTAINCYGGGRKNLMETVCMVTGFTISPFIREELPDLFFMRQINIIAERLS